MTRTQRIVGPYAYKAARFLIWLVCNTLFRIEIVGKENIPKEGGFILSPIHRANLDGLITSILTKRILKYMAKREIFKGFWGWLWTSMGAIPVNRTSSDRAALKASTEALEQGHGLVLFPEGTRRKGPNIETLEDGAVYLALKTGVPVVPVGIADSDIANPPGQTLFKPARVKVVIGEPMSFTGGGSGRVSRAVIDEGKERLRVRLQELYDESKAMRRR